MIQAPFATERRADSLGNSGLTPIVLVGLAAGAGSGFRADAEGRAVVVVVVVGLVSTTVHFLVVLSRTT